MVPRLLETNLLKQKIRQKFVPKFGKMKIKLNYSQIKPSVLINSSQF